VLGGRPTVSGFSSSIDFSRRTWFDKGEFLPQHQHTGTSVALLIGPHQILPLRIFSPLARCHAKDLPSIKTGELGNFCG
jgi:hypothetical protein